MDIHWRRHLIQQIRHKSIVAKEKNAVSTIIHLPAQPLPDPLLGIDVAIHSYASVNAGQKLTPHRLNIIFVPFTAFLTFLCR